MIGGGFEAEVTSARGGQGILDDLAQLFTIELVKEEILKYLNGSALINLSSVNSEIRHGVISSQNYKKKFNLRVDTKWMDFFSTTELSLPGWAHQLTNCTLVCNNSEMIFISPEKFSSFAKILPNLNTLEIINASESSYDYAATFLNKILLDLSSNLKSLSLPYDLMQNPIDQQQFQVQQLQELKFTTSPYNPCKVKSDNFVENLNFFASNCFNLKRFSCQEVAKVEGRYVNRTALLMYGERDFDGILTIIENNLGGLEKLEFGPSGLLACPSTCAQFSQISFPRLKFFDLRTLQLESSRVLDILKKLPGQLTTLKLTLTIFPPELFQLIPQQFPQLKCLYLKASRFGFISRDDREKLFNDPHSPFLQFLAQLEELEFTRFLIEYNSSDFRPSIFRHFREILLQHNNLRKLSLNCVNHHLPDSTAFYNGIAKMTNLKELALTGCPMFIDDFTTICSNLKFLEKLEISYLYSDQINPESTGGDGEIDLGGISAQFSSLIYLKELFIELCYTDFTSVLGSMSFPFLKSLTLVNENFGNDETLHNILGLNPMLKKLTIVTYDKHRHFEIESGRNNFKIENIFRQIRVGPTGGQYSDDCDPDSKPLAEREINWN